MLDGGVGRSDGDSSLHVDRCVKVFVISIPRESGREFDLQNWFSQHPQVIDQRTTPFSSKRHRIGNSFARGAGN